MKAFCAGLVLFLVSTVSFAQLKTSQRSIGMTISLPWVNNYFYYDYQLKNTASKTGFIGIGAAVFYKNRKNKFSVNYGMTTDFPIPIPAPIEYVSDSPRTTVNSYFIDAIVHHSLLKHFNAIGGVNFQSYRFNFIGYATNNASYVKKDGAFGLTVGIEYQFSRNSSIVVLYRPGVVPSSESIYRHVLTLDLRFDLTFSKQ